MQALVMIGSCCSAYPFLFLFMSLAFSCSQGFGMEKLKNFTFSLILEKQKFSFFKRGETEYVLGGFLMRLLKNNGYID
jgi:hypothetical protein